MGKLNLKAHLKETKNEKFVPLSTEWLRQVQMLDPVKIDLIELMTTGNYEILEIIGGKGSGKTIIAELILLWSQENHPKASNFAGRKYKDQATQQLGDYFARTLNLVGLNGYKTRYPYERKRNRFYALKSPRDMFQNSYQQYFSIDEIGSTDGSAPANFGYYEFAYIDEPIVKDDMLNPDKIPTKQKWESDIDQLKSNLKRYNEEFAKYSKAKKVPITKFIYTMNDWGKHPLTEDFNKEFSQDQFIKAITGYEMKQLMGNKELLLKLMKYDENDDDASILDSEWGKMWLRTHTLYIKNEIRKSIRCRMTIFANPDERKPETAKESLYKIAVGFLTENMALLAHYSGLQYNAQPDSDLLVYNVQNFNETTFPKLLKEGWVPKELSFGLDLDTSRVNTLTPAFKMEQHIRQLNNTFLKREIVFVDKIIELPANGSGAFGEMHELTAKQIALTIKKYVLEKAKNPIFAENVDKTYLIIDDNRKHYVHLLKQNVPAGYISHFDSAIKQGHYDIINRQDIVETSFHQKKLLIDIENEPLKLDIKACVKASPNIAVRTTAGSINYLDRIDSMEYAIYPFHARLSRLGREKYVSQKTKGIGE